MPIFIIGATGPMDETKRRPRIDWTHTAQVQGEAVRDYTKWDYQPTVVDGVPESFARAYGVMMTEPQGPIYMCYDAWLQEQPLDHEVPLPPQVGDAGARAVHGRTRPRSSVPRTCSPRRKRPVILAEFVGRDPKGFHALVELAETLGAPVYDVNSRLNFPSRHPLNVSMVKDVFRDADLILCLDVRDWERATTELESQTRAAARVIEPKDCIWIDIGFGDLELSSWAMDYQRLKHAQLRILADTTLAIPALTALLRKRISGERRAREARRGARAQDCRAAHASQRAKWAKEAREDWDATPITLPRLAHEVWEVIKHEDWVLTAGTLEDWALQAVGFRQALSPSRQVARHRDADRHLARGRARASRHGRGWWSTCSPTAT